MYSKAEAAVVEYLKRGYANQKIADCLFVSEKTIKFHLTNIYKKAGVGSRAELIALDQNHQRGQMMNEILKPLGQVIRPVEESSRPLEQSARQVQVVGKSQEQKIQFIDEKFKVGDTITQLHNMMTEVTKDQINPSTVNAACNCVARLNETINTAIQAARFLNER
jgi:DNA-binding CsgD family transcriptional regulator